MWGFCVVVLYIFVPFLFGSLEVQRSEGEEIDLKCHKSLAWRVGGFSGE